MDIQYLYIYRGRIYQYMYSIKVFDILGTPYMACLINGTIPNFIFTWRGKKCFFEINNIKCPSETMSLPMLTVCLKGFNNCLPIYKLQS